jgi:hypothetical protein
MTEKESNQLKKYLAAERLMDEKKLKTFCEIIRKNHNKETLFYDYPSNEDPQESPDEKVVSSSVNIYIISLQKNKKIRDYFNRNKIKGGKFLEITTLADLNRIYDANMIYFISNKDITSKFKERLKEILLPDVIKIVMTNNDFKNLKDICTTYIRTAEDIKGIHWFLKQIIEAIAIPSLVGLDYSDVKQVFLMSPNIELKRFQSNDIEELIQKIEMSDSMIESCFFVINGTPDLTIDQINYFSEEIQKDSKFCAWGAKINDELKKKWEVSLFIGSRK